MIPGSITRNGGLATEPGSAGQWHLRNTGQSGGLPGIDINVVKAWLDYTGSGVKIGIVDDGFDLAHADLAANFKGGWDSVGNDPSPAAGADNPHGTAVAGLVGADDNGTGLIGVAHDADLYGFRIDFSPVDLTDPNAEFLLEQQFLQQVDAIGRQAQMDVSVNAWGYVYPFFDNFLDPEGAALVQAGENAVANGRGGLGTVLVFAAGNGRSYGDSVNHHNLENNQYAIAVAAIDATGNVELNSNPGAALLVSAPGAAVLTTDQTGASGYDPGDTVVLTGTSFAAPIVGGVVALMLEANAGLGYRDVQDILAASARPIDVADPGWTTNGARTWNGGGHRFSNDYGFGLVDATAAVRLAETWFAAGDVADTFHNRTIATASWATGAAIPDGSAAGVATTASLAAALRIERIELEIDLVHDRLNDLVVELVSPSGTVSRLLDRPGAPPGFEIIYTNAFPLYFTLTSNAFRGESAAGTWTLRTKDVVSGATGTLHGWTLRAIGDAPGGDDTYIYTDAFAALGEPSRRVLADNGGIDTINASAVSAASSVNLASLAVSIGGTAITIAPGTVIENVIGGDGNDLLVGNAATNILLGGRGNDRIYGQGGGDRLDGGDGDDMLHARSGDVVIGGAGTDTVRFLDAPGGITASLAIVGPQHTGGGGIVTLSGIEYITGSAFDDVLVGDAGDNLLSGGDGDDLLEGGLGTNRLQGGTGIDLASYANAAAPVKVYLNSASSTGGAGIDYFESIEGFLGSAFNDALVGNTGANVLRGGAGNDRLYGLDGDDILRGGPGDDVLYGGAGVDTADYSDAAVPVRALLGINGTVNTINFGRDRFFDIENLAGGSANDVLVGDAGANVLTGNAGDDKLDGGAGDDTLIGGDGKDDFFGGLGADLIELGAASGNELVRYGTAADSRAAAMDRLVGFTTAGAGFDRIGFENAAGALFAGVAPTAIVLSAKVTLASATSVADLAAQLGTLAASGPTTLALCQVDVTAGAMAGSYLTANDMVAGFDPAADMLIGIQFAGGSTLGTGNFFLF
jgi:subtilisin-like proprotein convertase family protein